MANPEARENLKDALTAISGGNYAQAELYLKFAVKKWPEQCDLTRALVYAHTQTQTRPATEGEIASICSSLATFDQLIGAIDSDLTERYPVLTWNMPLLEIPFQLITRGQLRAAHAAALIEQRRYDEARTEIDAARREKVTRPESSTITEVVISTIECLLLYRTARWTDLLDVAAALSSMNTANTEVNTWSAAIGNAFGGSALAHLGNHTAGQPKLISAVESSFPAIASWAALQLGLSYRTAGEEDRAQTAFAAGLQYAALPELMEAVRNDAVTLTVTTPELIAARTSFWDPASEPDREEFARESSKDERDELLRDALAQLDALDGMDNVKEEVHILADELEHARELKLRGVETASKARHMVFKGPPGTGKTTVARLIAQLFYALGLIPKKDVLETSRVNFVAKHVGESTHLTAETVGKALGGVLFIDEAYAIYEGGADGVSASFSKEAITELLRLMENHRDNLIVILAGYAGPMDEFLRGNPGFRSRIPYELTFDTYSADQMWRIFEGMVTAAGWNADPAMEGAFKRAVSEMHARNHKNIVILDELGNARFARNVLERSQRLASRRLKLEGVLSTASTEELVRLKAEDVLKAMSMILTEQGLHGLVNSVSMDLASAGA